MKDPNSDQQKEMSQVLLGGRGQQKRLYAVDEKIYGTEEGAKLQHEAQEKAKNKKRKKKKNAASGNDGNIEGSESTSWQENGVKQSVAAVELVGVLAAGASVLLGGKRS